MKKFTRTIACVLIFASLFSLSAFAAPGRGLNAFEKIADMGRYTYSDLVTNYWAYSGIKICYDRGIMIGYPDGTFGPQRDITRAETMTLVNRVLNRQPETEDDLLPNMTVWTDNANPKAWYYLAVQEATNSHYYKFKTNSKYEKWTELRETRDWTQLEK